MAIGAIARFSLWKRQSPFRWRKSALWRADLLRFTEECGQCKSQNRRLHGEDDPTIRRVQGSRAASGRLGPNRPNRRAVRAEAARRQDNPFAFERRFGSTNDCFL